VIITSVIILAVIAGIALVLQFWRRRRERAQNEKDRSYFKRLDKDQE
jgi:FtsZ-interacting cell division protein ZipA